MNKVLDVLNRWTNSAPRDYAKKLLEKWGLPTGISKNSICWTIPYKQPYLSVTVIDEYIAHDFPKPHHDFVYTTISLKQYGKLTPDDVCSLAKVSGSILCDTLKQEATARCGGLYKNDVTLAFVIDVMQRKTKATKDEYARRITGDIVTRLELNLAVGV